MHPSRCFDCHVHAWRPGARFTADLSYMPSRDAPFEQLIALLDAHDVDGAVIVQPSFFGTDTTELEHALEAWPDRLRGVAVVPEDVDQDRLSAIRVRGVVGVRLNLAHAYSPNVASKAFAAFVARVTEAGLHVQVHAQEPGALLALMPVIEAAGARLVVDHFGRPAARLGSNDPDWRQLLAYGETGQLYVKLSAPYRLGGQPIAPLASYLLDCLGHDRLVWASDWPWTRFEEGRDYREGLHQLASWFDDDETIAAIAAGTPRALYGFA
ncbi:MAG: amidohydrolase family protein [Hyphomicrobiaceae bacterium]